MLETYSNCLKSWYRKSLEEGEGHVSEVQFTLFLCDNILFLHQCNQYKI